MIDAKGSQPVARPTTVPQERNLFGALEGKITAPDSLLYPMLEEELKSWEGG